jgi:hypothetical protein
MCANSLNAADKTLRLDVKNVGFLLDRLGQDCDPLQFLRELTQNAIEALQAGAGKGEVTWDVDWNRLDLDNVYKLCVIDTGIGMTGPEMVEYINRLSSSAQEQSLEGNFGVGAKIAAAPRNRHGIVYLSWKEGRGSMVHLWRDPTTNEYGLKQYERPDGTFGHFVEIIDDLKPSPIKAHGTMVVLLGNEGVESTVQPPSGTPAPSRWIAKYLNTRYYRFPDGITVKAREGWENPRTDSDRNKLRTVTGQEKYLKKHAESSGSVELSGAVAHWWILRDGPHLTQESNYYASAGHVAALHRDELYEISAGRGSTALLQQFGVIFGSRRVAIYVEPRSGGELVITTTTARTRLFLNQQPLPWSDWAAEFESALPPEIRELVRESTPTSSGTDYGKSIRERLKPLLDQFKVNRYRLMPSGPVLVDEASRTRGGQAVPRASVGTGRGTGRGGGHGGRGGDIYALFQRTDGLPAIRVDTDPYPTWNWVTAKDGTRSPGDLEDRAARFLKNQNHLLINGDFRGFGHLTEYWIRELDGAVALRPIIEEILRTWFTQALVETVLGVQALEGSPEWGADDLQRALSDEALTASVMQRYHINFAVKRELGSKLGKLPAA